MNDVPQIVEINEIIEETPTIKTFVFDWDMDCLLYTSDAADE
mgnify:CR=1 FL=1